MYHRVVERKARTLSTDGALCRNSVHGPDLWHSQEMGEIALAKSICKECPLVDKCLKYAIDNDERLGVWGGTTPRERGRFYRTRF